MIKRRIAIITSAGLFALSGAACGTAATSSSSGSSSAGSSTNAPASSSAQPPAGMGTVVTGTAAAKAGKAATAKYAGTVEKVMKLSDGSYVVHVVTSSGEKHVKVSSAFTVTGVETGPPAGAQPPASTTSSS